MQNGAALVHNCGRLARASATFEIPHIATRQKNFGPIVKEVTKHHKENVTVYEKKKFSMFIPEVERHIRSLN